MNKKELGESLEDYLESMKILKEKNGYVRSVDIAEHMNVSKPSVSVAMKKLRDEGFIEMDKSSFINMTDSGKKIADTIYNKHKILAQFFIHLGVSEETAYSDACKIEHDISEETFNALCKHAGIH
jgi:Mn-dependent DtxR family transcriptional regulator